MGTTRQGSAGQGMHRYKLSNGMEAVRMADRRWRVFDNKGGEPWDAGDTGQAFKTLRECRGWSHETMRKCRAWSQKKGTC